MMVRFQMLNIFKLKSTSHSGLLLARVCSIRIQPVISTIGAFVLSVIALLASFFRTPAFAIVAGIFSVCIFDSGWRFVRATRLKPQPEDLCFELARALA